MGTVSCSKEKEKQMYETFYTVSFDADGGTPVPDDQQVKEGERATAPANPAREGYVFLFWSLSGSSEAFDFQIEINSDVTLVAKWEEEIEYQQVIWELNGGEWDPANDDHVTQIVKGKMLAIPADPIMDGATFEGWYKDAGLTSRVSFPYYAGIVTNKVTLYAKWETEIEYWQVSWELNGGAWGSNDNHATWALKGEKLDEPTDPIMTGNILEGWYKEAALINRVSFPCDVTSDLTLYAKWVTDSWKVSWGLNGGEWDPANDDHATSVLKDDVLARPADPIKEYNTFEGWYTDAELHNEFSFTYYIDSDFTLYAKWYDTRSGYFDLWKSDVDDDGVWEQVSISANRIELLDYKDEGFTMENLTWTKISNQGGEYISYFPTGYRITGTLTNVNNIHPPKNDGSAARIGDIAVISIYIYTGRWSIMIGNIGTTEQEARYGPYHKQFVNTQSLSGAALDTRTVRGIKTDASTYPAKPKYIISK
jgi:uncharacterized repeat protein (TIGR02543 family)